MDENIPEHIKYPEIPEYIFAGVLWEWQDYGNTLDTTAKFLEKNKGILKIYSDQPDFDEKKTKYFISHARKHKYKPYNCSNMKLFNLCIKECNVKNPIVIFSRNARKKISREKSTFQNHTNQNHKQQKY